jgi:hypothetical protein
MAAEKGQIELLNKLREWAIQVLTQENLKHMSLAKDEYERNAWHMAGKKGQIEILHKLWRAKDLLTQEELNN